MSARRCVAAAVAIAAWSALAVPAFAQQVSGRVFEDRDGDGVRDAGEPGSEAVAVRLFGQVDATGAFDQSVATAADGSFSFAPGNGCYLLRPDDPVGWRATGDRVDLRADGAAGYPFPAGLARFGKLDQGIANLLSGSFRYAAMGDSIATNFDWCDNIAGNFLYSRRLRDRLACVAPGATVTLDQAAVKGEHTDDLLVDDTADLNNVFRVLDNQPDLVSISMIGNDLLDVDVDNPTQAQTNTAVEEILDARRNLQEALSAMLAGVPGLDITLNSLYDNLADRCYAGTPTTAFHREWLPIVTRVLRDVAWGQARRVSVNEVAAEFAREDLVGQCSGYDNLICRNFLDGIHPVQAGYDVVTEKVWEATGGVNLGPKDVVGRTTQPDADFGYLRRVARLRPTAWEALAGAAVTNPEAALDGDDGGATASVRLGVGAEEVRWRGFPDWFDEFRIVRVIAGVRYRAGGTFQDDLYRVEASPTGVFVAPPGHAYSTTDWNFSTPIVGGGGPNAPAGRPDYPNARLLVEPRPTALRTVSATLTKNPVVGPGEGEYTWPAITHEDLATTEMRVVAAPVGATPGVDGRVEVDELWLDLYGWEAARPVEAEDVRIDRGANGAIEVSFVPVPGAARHNLYWGRLDSLRAGGYDHGAGAPAGPDCAATVVDAGGGRAKIVVPAGAQPADAAYALVTGHVDDVESPAGRGSDGTEIDRAQSVCR